MNLLFAWRYFKSKKSTNAINIIAWISVLAIGIGTAALIIVLSVFNGFEGLVKSMYGDFYADILVLPQKGKFIEIPMDKKEQINRIQGIGGSAFFVEEKAVLVNDDYQAIVYLRGIDSAYSNVNGINKHILEGSFDLGNIETPYMVAGAGISNAVGADPENKLGGMVVYLPNRKSNNFSSLDAMHSSTIFTSGIFSVQQEFDDKYAFTNLDFMQYMLDLKPDEYSGFEIALKQGVKPEDVQKKLQELLGNAFKVQTRYEQNQSLFSVMQMEKWVIYGILSLILGVAAFNMIGALTMLVLEKQKDISVLKAMGASNNRIQNIFLNEGFLLALFGGIGGMILALIICWLQVHFKLVGLQGGSFIIDYYPVKISITDFGLVGFTVFFISVLAAWLPSRKAAQQDLILKS
ncbi:MAG: ABC transporter permease [Bacteroidetes bacterium]|nr:ABC transporter permease [Bacteroidota bacterium]